VANDNRLDLRRHQQRSRHRDHLKVFATPELADEWFKENDREGVAFQYEVLGDEAPPAILIDTRD
jgi:hypothetical protein